MKIKLVKMIGFSALILALSTPALAEVTQQGSQTANQKGSGEIIRWAQEPGTDTPGGFGIEVIAESSATENYQPVYPYHPAGSANEQESGQMIRANEEPGTGIPIPVSPGTLYSRIAHPFQSPSNVQLGANSVPGTRVPGSSMIMAAGENK